MFVRDFINRVRSAKDAAGRRMPSQVAASIADADDRSRMQDFMPITIPPAPSGPDIWGFAQFVSGDRLLGYMDDGKKVVDAPWSPPGGGVPLFVESKEGWLYGVFRSSGKYRSVKRFRVNSAGTAVSTVEDLVDFPTGKIIAGGHGFSTSVWMDPDGATVYFKTADDPQDFDHQPEGDDYLRLRNVGGIWTIDTVGTIEEAVPSHSDFQNAGGGLYDVVLHNVTVKRRFKPTVLGDGRWMAADFLIIVAWGEHELLDGEVTGQCQIGNFSFPCTGGVYQPTTARAWGNAWWDKASPTSAWVARANGGVSTDSGNFGLSVFLQVVQQGGAPSSLRDSRVAHATTEHLPTARLVKNFGTGQGNETDIPSQAEGTIYADAASLYLMMHGERDDDDSEYHPLGVYKAPIPVGVAPSWTKIIDEPNLDATPSKSWQHYVVPTRSKLWIPEFDSTNQRMRWLTYPKTGGSDPTIVREDTSVFESESVQYSVAGWSALWK